MRYRASRALVLLALLVLGACGGQQSANSPTTAAPTAVPTAPAPTVAPPSLPTAAPTAPAPTANPTPTLAPGMFANPVIDRDFPDPDTLKVGDTYYAYATGNAEAQASVQAARSRDLVHWDMLPDAMPDFPQWAEHDRGLVWAPEVTTSADGKTYLLYFVARVAGTSRQCIGMAASAKPEGPFESPAPKPLICQEDQGGSIDPSSFVDEDGTRYLLWKNDGNCCGQATWIYIQKISSDGRMLEGEPARLITADQRWEGALVEAPTLWKHAGKYYLFYSANDYSTPNYAVGYAVADSPLGPYQKPAKPLLVSDLKNAVVGPGGQDIAVDKDGETWMVYHTWGPGYRSMSIDELGWQGDTPVLKGPDGRKTPQPVP
jgi:beta-xylosidase